MYLSFNAVASRTWTEPVTGKPVRVTSTTTFAKSIPDLDTANVQHTLNNNLSHPHTHTARIINFSLRRIHIPCFLVFLFSCFVPCILSGAPDYMNNNTATANRIVVEIFVDNIFLITSSHICTHRSGKTQGICTFV